MVKVLYSTMGLAAAVLSPALKLCPAKSRRAPLGIPAYPNSSWETRIMMAVIRMAIYLMCLTLFFC